MLEKWGRTEVAEFLEVSERQVGRYLEQQEDPLPCIKENRNNVYDPIAVKNWVIRRALSGVSVDVDGKVYVYDIEKARLTYHQANIAAMDESIKRGELIPAELFERCLFDIFTALRAKALSIPTKTAHQLCALTSIQEIEAVLKEQVDEALTEMSENNVRRIIFGSGRKSAEESAEATTETDRQ